MSASNEYKDPTATTIPQIFTLLWLKLQTKLWTEFVVSMCIKIVLLCVLSQKVEKNPLCLREDYGIFPFLIAFFSKKTSVSKKRRRK